jgi:hypothetical protein
VFRDDVTPAGRTAAAPSLQHLLHLRITVADAIDVGVTPEGHRRIVPITGGLVTGPLFAGRVIPGGNDVQYVRNDTETTVLARYVLESDRGEVVLVTNGGIRSGSVEDIERLRRDEPVDPERIYFRSVPTFETAAPRLARLNSHVYVGSGIRMAGLVLFDFFEVQ